MTRLPLTSHLLLNNAMFLKKHCPPLCLTLCYKKQNIVLTMPLTMLIAHPYCVTPGFGTCVLNLYSRSIHTNITGPTPNGQSLRFCFFCDSFPNIRSPLLLAGLPLGDDKNCWEVRYSSDEKCTTFICRTLLELLTQRHETEGTT